MKVRSGTERVRVRGKHVQKSESLQEEFTHYKISAGARPGAGTPERPASNKNDDVNVISNTAARAKPKPCSIHA